MGFAKGSTHPTTFVYPTGKSLNPVQPPLQKYFCSRLTQITSISPAVLSHRGAARDRHERGAGCGGRGSVGRVRGSQGRLSWACERTKGAQTNGANADGEVVWSWHPLLVLNRRRQVARPGLTNLNPPMTVAT
jgi:hypothetical protein